MPHAFRDIVHIYSGIMQVGGKRVTAPCTGRADGLVDFVRRIEAVKKGDMSIITEMMDVAKNCVPEEVRVFHNWLGDVLNGKVKMADITQSIQGLSIEHIHMIAKCLVYNVLLPMHM